MGRARRKESQTKQQSKQARARKAVPPMGSGIGRFLRKRWRWLLAGVVLLHIALALITLQPALHTGGDNAAYLTLARSLLERHEYRDLFDPSEPMHAQYPPVYPIILALAITIGLKSWLQFKFITVAFSAVAVAFSYLWIRKRGRPELAFGVALLLALSPGVLDQSHWELSDVPFWALTMIAMWGWQRLPRGLRPRFFIAVVMTTLSYFTRSAGLPLIVAAGAWLAWRKRWQQLAIFAAVIGPLALLWWLRSQQKGGVDYVGYFWWLDPYNPALGRIGIGDLFTRIANNAGHYLSIHLPMLLFGVEGLLPLSLLITALALYGWLVRLRRPGVAELFLPLYIGLLLIWPAVWSGERFLLPALPFLLFYAGDGLVRLTRMLARRSARIPAAVAAALIIIIGIPATARAVKLGTGCMVLYRDGDRYACLPDQYKDYYSIAEISKRLLPEGSTVLSRKARTFYILGGVPGRQFPLSDDPVKFFQEVAGARARYVVFDGLDGLAQAYLAPVMLKKTNAFCVMFSLGPGRATMFGIDPEAAARASVGGGAESVVPCPVQYWRSPAVKDSLYRGLIPL